VDFSQYLYTAVVEPTHALPILFIAGVLTSLAPCIYPMIPITAAIVGGSAVGGRSTSSLAHSASHFHLRFLGLRSRTRHWDCFAGLTGTLFGSVSTNPWLYFAMANLLIIAALAMLDVIPVRVPTWLLTRAATAGEGGSLYGVFVMGAASGLVAAPCSAPVMAAVLTWVTATKSGVLGFIYLFVFSLGMCTLLVLVGLFSGTLARLPRAGAWMVWIKRIFAIDHVGRCGVLPCPDGAAPHLKDVQYRNHNLNQMNHSTLFPFSRFSLNRGSGRCDFSIRSSDCSGSGQSRSVLKRRR